MRMLKGCDDLLQIAQDGVPIYGLNYKDDDAAASRWLTQLGDPYRANIADREGSLGLDLGVYGAPETYLLDAAGVSYTINPRLVRGLDYYSRTVFEWVTDALGAQGAVCSGGRYDGLVEKLGGRATPAIGWAMGIERYVALFEACGGKAPDTAADVYIVAVGEGTLHRAVRLAEQLRDAIAGVRVELNLGGGSFKSQMKRADNSNAEYALILGERELAEGRVGLKPMQTREEQASVDFDEVASILAGKLDKAAARAGAENK